MFPASGLILLPMTEPWLHPTGQLASPRARDCCPERSEEANRKHTQHVLTAGSAPHLTHVQLEDASFSLCVLGHHPVASSWEPGSIPLLLQLGPRSQGKRFEDASPALMPPTILTVDPCVWGQIPSLCHVCAMADNKRGWGGLGSPGGHGGKGTNHIKAETGK